MIHRRTPITPLLILAVLLAVPAILIGAQHDEAVDEKDRLAAKLVKKCAGVGEGDKVWISGGVRDMDLLENIAVHARSAGAFPLLTVESDRLTRRMYHDVPARYDSQKPELGLKLASLLDVSITVDASESDGVLKGASAERLAARAKAGEGIGRTLLERGVRQVNLGNGLYPTEERAARFGITRKQLADIFWAGVNVDYTRLEALGSELRSALRSGGELHIKNPNGTNLRLRIEGRPVLVSDGVISAEERKRGGPACQTWLPAGEVYLAPVPGTATGKVVVDRHFFQGKKIKDLKMTFENGRMTEMKAESGLAPLRALYEASGEGKDLFGAVDIGMNPKVKIPAESKMVAWMASGMVTVGIGNNEWAGGDNRIPFGLYTFLPGSTVKLDGKTIVDAGKLKIKG